MQQLLVGCDSGQQACVVGANCHPPSETSPPFGVVVLSGAMAAFEYFGMWEVRFWWLGIVERQTNLASY